MKNSTNVCFYLASILVNIIAGIFVIWINLGAGIAIWGIGLALWITAAISDPDKP